MDLIGRDVCFQKERDDDEDFVFSPPVRVLSVGTHGFFARDERGLWFIPWVHVGHMLVVEETVDLSKLPELNPFDA